MPDRRAEQHALAGRDGQQGDLIIEVDILLDDHSGPVAAHVGDGIIERRAKLGRGSRDALALAARRHHRLDHRGQPDPRGDRLFARLGENVARGGQPQLLRREVADAVAVHGQLDGFRRRHDMPALALKFGQHRRVDRLDLGNDMVGAVLLDRAPQRRAVEHREDFARVGALHRRRIVIAVAGDHPAAEPFRGDREFAAKLARAKQEDRGHGAP